MIFNSYYCRVCYCFRIAGGQISRYLTTFDAAIYSIIYSLGAGYPRPQHFHCEKFGTKNLAHFRDDEVGKIFVDASYIAIGEKARDDRLDGDNARAWAIERLFGKQIERVRKERPEAQSILSAGFDELNKLQDQNEAPMVLFDFYADVSSQMFLALFDKPISGGYLDLLKGILKWTFFADMVCDYEEDLKSNAFNSFQDKSCKTFGEYFEKHYLKIFEINQRINGEIMDALTRIHDGSQEWRILYRVITYSLNNVIQDKIAGRDPHFKLVSETVNNWKSYLRKLPEKESQ